MARDPYPFNRVGPSYRPLWDRATINATASRVTAAAELVLAGRSRYVEVERATGAPWWWVGVIHYRESGCDFAGVLHNGEKIIGTGRKTRLVPAGRGPFKTWQVAAVDALEIKGIRPGAQVWTLEMALWQGERFNGFGYRARRVPSAYLWSGTTVYKGGKYIADHEWSATAMDKQLGIVPIIMRLMEIDPSVQFANAPPAVQATPTPAEPVPPVDAPAAIDPDDGLSKGEVRALQQRLRDLGYSEVGRVDGLWGPRTVAAVSAFQATADLPVTGKLDKTTAATLTTAGPRPVGESRETTTAATMRQHGDPVAKASWWQKTWAWVMGAPAAAVGIVGQTGDATDKLGPVKTFLGDVPMWAWAGAVVGVAIALYVLAQRAERAAVDAVRTGRDAGPA